MRPRFAAAVLVAALAVPACTSLLDLGGFEYVENAATTTAAQGPGGSGGSEGGSGPVTGPGGGPGSTTSTAATGGGGGAGAAGGGGDPCGNGNVDPGEDCDGGNLGSASSCQDLGLAGGVLGCSSSCSYQGCYDHYQQDFEGNGLPSGWTSNSPTPWQVTSDEAHSGAQSAVSGPIGDSDSTSISVTLTYDVPGDIIFWHLESTEACCDFLYWEIDGNPTHSWGDPLGWTEEVHGVGPGVHTFTWTYTKDGGVVEGDDWVRIDHLQAVNGYLP